MAWRVTQDDVRRIAREEIASAKSVPNPFCGFCGKGSSEVLVLIAGPTVFICDECVELCRDIVGQHRSEKLSRPKASA
jgi:hypothetical protein